MAQSGEALIGGNILSGLTHAFKSPYLINLSVYMLLFAITSTLLYFQQLEIARQSFAERGERTAFFAASIYGLTSSPWERSFFLRAVSFGPSVLPLR